MEAERGPVIEDRTFVGVWIVLLFLTLLLALSLTGMLRSTDWFIDHFNYAGVSFFTGYTAIFMLDILVALSVLAVLWLMKRERKAFFFVMSFSFIGISLLISDF